MPEAQLAVTGYNIAGLDPIEVPHSSTGTTLDLSADTTAYGKMHVMSGSANYTCILPPATGHEGETIGFRGSSALTSVVTLDGSSAENLDNVSTLRLIANEARHFRATSGNWVSIASNPLPFGKGALSASSNAAQTVTAGVATKLNCNTVDSPTTKLNGGGWYNATTNTYAPTLSGYYLLLVTASVPLATSDNTWSFAYVYKNGSLMKTGPIAVVPTNFGSTASVTAFTYATTSDSYQPWGATSRGQFSSSNFQAIYLGGE